MGVVQDPLADRVGDGGVPQLVVPARWREVAGGEANLKDFKEVAALLVLGGGQAPVDDEDVEPGEASEQGGVGAVGVGEGELVEQARGPAVEIVRPTPPLSHFHSRCLAFLVSSLLRDPNLCPNTQYVRPIGS